MAWQVHVAEANRAAERLFGFKPQQETFMKLTRVIFIALALALPASWTVAKAEEGAAPAGETTKKEKKAKKAKKADAPAEGDKKEEKK
jgi:hypothetical protein